MGVDYVFFAAFLLYYLAVKLIVSQLITPLQASVVVVLGAYIFDSVLELILLTGYAQPLANVISLRELALVAIQLLAAYGVFYMIDRGEESYVSWIGWSLAGFVVIFLLLPRMIGA